MTLWLLDHGADPNKQCSIDLTPLSYAVEQASPPTVKLLLDRGGDVHKGQLLHHAVDRQTDTIEILGMLLERGAPLNSKMYENHYPSFGDYTISWDWKPLYTKQRSWAKRMLYAI